MTKTADFSLILVDASFYKSKSERQTPSNSKEKPMKKYHGLKIVTKVKPCSAPEFSYIKKKIKIDK